MNTDAAASRIAAPIPARAGIGLRAQHHQELAQHHALIGWLEAHSENYFADGGAQIESLARAREHYPLSLHGVGLSLGSTDPFNMEHLRKLKRLINWSEPALVSEHLSWSSVEDTFMNDLLPLPYTDEALSHMIQRVSQLQDYLGRQILVENISSYLQFNCSQIKEWDFITALAAESGCGLLIDVNNIYVNSRNHIFDAQEYIRALPRNAVKELHLAGHRVNHYGDREILIDTHSTPVCDAVWHLYEFTLAQLGELPTLIEWDTDIPALDVLMAEAGKANAYLERHELAA